MRYSMKVMVGTIAVAAGTAMAGPSPGQLVVLQAVAQFDEVVEDYAADAEAIANACVVKLERLDSRGATDEQLTAAATASMAKLLARTDKVEPKLDKVAGRAIGRLGAIFEDDVIDQVTAVVDDHASAGNQILGFGIAASNDIQDALAAEIAD